MDMLTITNLKKRFGDKEVLCGLNLSVPSNSVFGFVGRNGAGKTTTMKAVLGLLKPDDGQIFVSGKKVVWGQTETNQYIGYLPDVPEFYSYMTPFEYLIFCGEICGMKKSDIKERSTKLLSLVGLENENHRIKGFSRGMKQRLGIAQALLSRPKLLICDEPTSALDPEGRKEILDILVAVKEETTVLFSTHILSDVEHICEEVAFLNEGKIVMQGKVSEIRNIRSSKEFTLEVINREDTKKLMDNFKDIRHTEENTLVFSGEENKVFDVLRYVYENKISIQKMERIEPSLEDVFLEVMKK
ncbi:MAG: ABC transporter ATP-binding protein [Lachnospiraceae bacterium]|nr:ABC transporter ATP-binding protein [Lachnospiraceae bacterium]